MSKPHNVRKLAIRFLGFGTAPRSALPGIQSSSENPGIQCPGTARETYGAFSRGDVTMRRFRPAPLLLLGAGLLLAAANPCRSGRISPVSRGWKYTYRVFVTTAKGTKEIDPTILVDF